MKPGDLVRIVDGGHVVFWKDRVAGDGRRDLINVDDIVYMVISVSHDDRSQNIALLLSMMNLGWVYVSSSDIEILAPTP
jgi:hypothetical protein